MHQHFCNLLQDIQDLLLSWVEHLKEASAIFVRAPSYNKTIFFGGRTAPLDKKDPRIRTLPFATRRATFREVQRVHEVLSTVQIYGKLNYILGIITCLIVFPPKKLQLPYRNLKITIFSLIKKSVIYEYAIYLFIFYFKILTSGYKMSPTSLEASSFHITLG